MAHYFLIIQCDPFSKDMAMTKDIYSVRWLWGAALLFLLTGSAACVSREGGSGPASAAPDFTLAASVDGLQVPAGGSGFAMVSAVRSNGFTGAIELSLVGLPVGVVAIGTIEAGAGSGRLTIDVAGDAAPRTLGSLLLDGQSGALERRVGFGLTIAPPLPASNLSPDQVSASGGVQRNGSLVNIGLVMEPVSHARSTSASGALEVRDGFLPDASPSTP